MSLDRMEKKRI